MAPYTPRAMVSVISPAAASAAPPGSRGSGSPNPPPPCQDTSNRSAGVIGIVLGWAEPLAVEPLADGGAGAAAEQPGRVGHFGAVRPADILTVVLLCYRRVMAVRKKRSVSIPPDLDAEIAAAAQAAGMSYSAWIAQTARKEFIIRAGLEAVGQYEAEHGPFTPDEIAGADEWAARVTQPSGTQRTA